ncbi:PhnE/PtxC family ABC transporter permease [Undibacterium oligocarboniphilum]|uniref:ABC transporter permease subunit n=1 Tax=Undibacterium oligocarboniphilum TaxID=666702 RepID=A0A850QFK6_9BURK|nr:ABC transporter permease subunit [Undibacterium oligocarboniphilum]MBC3871181.1 ABC transporter permease subunit [Undibacterium oligocarboniphilum]NVO79272.1 ABC transporter permease subunit [Undibacterium oligocarboniphilum]
MTNRVQPRTVVPPDPAWRKRLTIMLLGLLLLWPQLVITEFKPWSLLDVQSLSATGHFLGSFFPPAHDPDFLLLVLQATWQTIAMATAGVSLAIIAAIPMTLLITEQLSVSSLYQRRMHPWSHLLRQIIRWLLVLLRSVPELVWALLFVRITGLGPTAGVLAITLTYCGMLGKVYAEIIDTTNVHVSRTLLVNGSPRLATFLYSILPAAASELLSYTLYRWECAIRGSVVMGFVGAGGLGQRMDESMKMLAGAEVSTMLLVFVLLVAVADAVSQYFRKALA